MKKIKPNRAINLKDFFKLEREKLEEFYFEVNKKYRLKECKASFTKCIMCNGYLSRKKGKHPICFSCMDIIMNKNCKEVVKMFIKSKLNQTNRILHYQRNLK